MTDAPDFYDIRQDCRRPVTQDDVDQFVRIAQAYGQLRGEMMRAMDATYRLAAGEVPEVASGWVASKPAATAYDAMTDTTVPRPL